MLNILLDIDGVLITIPSWKQTENLEDGFPDFNATAIACLNQILEHTKGNIILTTSHKSRFSNNEWLDIFKKRGVNIDLIDKLPPNILRLRRKDEILNWLHKNPDADYIIIDDDKSLNEMSNFILTLPMIGLTQDDVDTIKRLII